LRLDALTAILRRAAREVSPDELPALLGELETAKALVWTRLVSAPTPCPAQPTRLLLDAAELAAETGLPESWLRDKARKREIRSVRAGHYVRFDPADVIEDLKRLRVTETEGPKPHRFSQ
jgi:hypothetical protein